MMDDDDNRCFRSGKDVRVREIRIIAKKLRDSEVIGARSEFLFLIWAKKEATRANATAYLNYRPEKNSQLVGKQQRNRRNKQNRQTVEVTPQVSSVDVDFQDALQ